MTEDGARAERPADLALIVLMGKIRLRPGDVVRCAHCGGEVKGRASLYFFRKRTKGGLAGFVWCEPCFVDEKPNYNKVHIWKTEVGCEACRPTCSRECLCACHADNPEAEDKSGPQGTETPV